MAPTGIAGLDDILRGGLPRNRLYLVTGRPGVGKTTLALQFLRDGASKGEACLYITLSETLEELGDVASSHGWSLDPLSLYELKSSRTGHLRDEYTMYHPSEVELNEAMTTILDEVERKKPSRVVIDSLSEIKLLLEQRKRRARGTRGRRSAPAKAPASRLVLLMTVAACGGGGQSRVPPRRRRQRR